MALFYIQAMRVSERKKMIEMYQQNTVELLISDFYATEEYSEEYMKKMTVKLTRNIGKYYKFIKKSYPNSVEPWGFPKGKKMINESDFEAALRETVEETKISGEKIKILEDFEPFVETYTGSDDKVYQSIFYLACIKKKDLVLPGKRLSTLFREYISNEIGEIFMGPIKSLVCKLSKNKCDFLSMALNRLKEKEIDKM